MRAAKHRTRDGICLKSRAEIRKMRRAGAIVSEVLRRLEEAATPGTTTAELDELAEDIIRGHGATPSFLGQRVENRRYPASTCVSLNDEVVHGIPRPDRRVQAGDIAGIDVGACWDGYHADAAVTVAVGEVSPEARQLLGVTRESLELGLAKVASGRWLSDVSRAIQEHVEAAGFSVVRALSGHGIGASLWEAPQVHNFVTEGRDVRLRAGMTLAIEPMVNAGHWEVRPSEDMWTMRTADGSLSAHFEHTVAITKAGLEILTASSDKD
ncbi:MAG: type I methionyl aminopeptidase [Armatimonadota bacterium]